MTLFSQRFPDTRAKLKHLGRGPLTPEQSFSSVFNVYHGRSEKAPKHTWASEDFLNGHSSCPGSLAFQSLRAPGSLFQMQSGDFWAQASLIPHKPPRPYPRCHQENHWYVNCLHIPHGVGTSSPDGPWVDILYLAMDEWDGPRLTWLNHCCLSLRVIRFTTQCQGNLSPYG